MSTCTRCGAAFTCAMADGADAPCWCTALPAVAPVPPEAAGCWCPACLARHIAAQQELPQAPGTAAP
ncbi:MAG: cysteine-rich CWC family protein [Telluria sp.]